MNFIKSHFGYNKRQRNGIFFLLLIIVALQSVFFFVDFSSKETLNFSSAEIAEFQREMDSLELVAVANKKPTLFPFNPNFITDYKGFQLGMSVAEIDKLLAYRKTGKFVNSVDEFQKVTGVPDSLLQVISPRFKFPAWVTANTAALKRKSSNKTKGPIVKQDINLVHASDLRIVHGIGEKLADRIIEYRTKLQGFSFNDQLYEVWNLDKELVDKVLKYFKVVEPPIIQKMNVNEATFKELLAIVYIDYELTKKIVNYRVEVAEIQDIKELKKIEGFPLEKFDRIALYLAAK